MSTNYPHRGGRTGRSVAPRKAIYKDDKPHPMWDAFRSSWRPLREAAGLSVAEVAQAMGVSVAKIYLYENGGSVPHPYDLCVYLDIIGVRDITAQ